jgi:hypothetical protein
MGGFDVPVLLRFSHVDAMALDPVMCQQRPILRCERLVTGKVVHRSRKAVAADPVGHAACAMQGILKPHRQGFVRLRVTKVNGFPVRIGEDRVEQKMRKRSPADGHPQFCQRHEIEGHHIPGVMHLGKDHFLQHVVVELPICHAAFQGSADRVGDHRLPLRRVVLLLEPSQEGDRLQARVLREKGFHFGPIIR